MSHEVRPRCIVQSCRAPLPQPFLIAVLPTTTPFAAARRGTSVSIRYFLDRITCVKPALKVLRILRELAQQVDAVLIRQIIFELQVPSLSIDMLRACSGELHHTVVDPRHLAEVANTGR